MLDASRAVVVAQNLLDKVNGPEYKKDVQDEYAELRKEYYASQKDKSFVPLAKIRAKKLKTDWFKMQIVKPSFLGTKTFVKYDLNKLLDFIDWDPFFQSW